MSIGAGYPSSLRIGTSKCGQITYDYMQYRLSVASRPELEMREQAVSRVRCGRDLCTTTVRTQYLECTIARTPRDKVLWIITYKVLLRRSRELRTSFTVQYSTVQHSTVLYSEYLLDAVSLSVIHDILQESNSSKSSKSSRCRLQTSIAPLAP